jgi:hypothetical protein
VYDQKEKQMAVDKPEYYVAGAIILIVCIVAVNWWMARKSKPEKFIKQESFTTEDRADLERTQNGGARMGPHPPSDNTRVRRDSTGYQIR